MINTLTIGKWTINVDRNRTAAYYEEHFERPEETQCSRNFDAFLEGLTEVEKLFFDSMGLDPFKCVPDTKGMTKNKMLPTFGLYHIFADIVASPEDISFSLDEAIANNFNFDWGEHHFDVGRFRFDISFEGSHKNPLQKSAPKGLIVLRFEVDEVPWLLNEKYVNAPDSLFKVMLKILRRIFSPRKASRSRKTSSTGEALSLRGRFAARREARRTRRKKKEAVRAARGLAFAAKKHVQLKHEDLNRFADKWYQQFGRIMAPDLRARKKPDIGDLSDFLRRAAAHEKEGSSEENAPSRSLRIYSGHSADSRFEASRNNSCYVVFPANGSGVLLDDLVKVDTDLLSGQPQIVVAPIGMTWTYIRLADKNDSEKTQSFFLMKP